MHCRGGSFSLFDKLLFCTADKKTNFSCLSFCPQVLFADNQFLDGGGVGIIPFEPI